jgi:PAS domain-containing protein
MTTALERLASLAAALVDAPMAAIVKVSPGRVDIVAGHQVSAIAYATDIDEAAVGFQAGQPGIICDTASNAYFAKHPLVTGAPFLGALIRLPLQTIGRMSLVIGFKEAIAQPDPERIHALCELANLAAREYELGRAHDSDGLDVAASLQQLINRSNAMDQPVALLDSSLRYLHVNPVMAKLNGRDSASHVGHSIREIGVPSVEALEAIFQVSLRDSRTFDQVELIAERMDKNVRVYSISCRPLRPAGQTEPVLEVIASDVTSLRATEARLENNLAEASLGQTFQWDPTVRFLTETLVKRQSLRQRKTTSYLTLRSWRKPVRSYQIEALKALKTAPPHSLVETAATEIVEAVGRIVGTSAFHHVTPIPCSRSAEDACLSRMIAEEVSRRVGKPLALLLGSIPRKGSSHPKGNMTRPPLHLLEPATGPCLIVDDVATSGAHLEEAITKLRPSAQSVFAVAWIGGDSDDKPEDD